MMRMSSCFSFASRRACRCGVRGSSNGRRARVHRCWGGAMRFRPVSGGRCWPSARPCARRIVPAPIFARSHDRAPQRARAGCPLQDHDAAFADPRGRAQCHARRRRLLHRFCHHHCVADRVRRVRAAVLAAGPTPGSTMPAPRASGSTRSATTPCKPARDLPALVPSSKRCMLRAIGGSFALFSPPAPSALTKVSFGTLSSSTTRLSTATVTATHPSRRSTFRRPVTGARRRAPRL